MNFSPPLRIALLAQLGGLSLVAILHTLFASAAWPILTAALLQGVFAAFISDRLGAPRWWLIIHLAFLPAALLLGRLQIPASWFLFGFIVLFLIYWRTDKSQVPLYLSNTATANALATLLPKHPCYVLDLGCGDARLLRQLARTRPDCAFLGIEHAPLPFLWGKLASSHLPNLEIRYGDFWQQSLTAFDVVYAFLSPVPMPRLMQQARTQMRPNTLLVSNSFAVPEIKPAQIVEVRDARNTQLYCYRLTLAQEATTTAPHQ